MEVQLTDFENAAFTAFIVLVTRCLLVFNLDLLVPLSKVDDNMQRAHKNFAAANETFWFRKHIIPDSECCGSNGAEPFEEMSMNEIINGKACYFPGLVPLCYKYLEHIQCDATSFARIHQYLTFISKRASGELVTPAVWMRQFVQNHPDYKQDSVVSPGIAYDLMRACDEVGRGVRRVPELHGNVVIEPVMQEGVYGTPLDSHISSDARRTLLSQLCKRAHPFVDGPRSGPSCAKRRLSPRA